MGRGAELEAQVFPSVFEGDTMGIQPEVWSSLAKMAAMVGSENTANPI